MSNYWVAALSITLPAGIEGRCSSSRSCGRPHTVIKDDAIPTLLRQQPQPTFVTINDRDFWQRVSGDPKYCMVCFALSDARTRQIPQSLRALFRHPEFRTKAQRMGKVIRVTREDISFYTSQTGPVMTLALEAS